MEPGAHLQDPSPPCSTRRNWTPSWSARTTPARPISPKRPPRGCTSTRTSLWPPLAQAERILRARPGVRDHPHGGLPLRLQPPLRPREGPDPRRGHRPGLPRPGVTGHGGPRGDRLLGVLLRVALRQRRNGGGLRGRGLLPPGRLRRLPGPGGGGERLHGPHRPPRLPAPGVEDNAVAILRFASGALGVIDAKWGQVGPARCAPPTTASRAP